MYEDNFKLSYRAKRSTQDFIKAITENYDAKNSKIESKHIKPYAEEANSVMENIYKRDINLNRYHSFVETVKNSLVVESIYKIYSEAVADVIKEDNSNRVVMRAIVNDYVQENGYTNILNTMKTASTTMSSIYNIINESATKIIESVDKTNPTTFTITPEMRDEFFKSLDYSDTEAISQAINARVSGAMQDFVTANNKDHEDITNALKQAQEKIANSDENDETLKEFYEMQGKRKANEVRNASKSIYHSMVSSMCESVIKHEEMHNEFMTEGHLNIDKIATRVSLMYSFLETLNTTRLDKINEAYLSSMIENLKK